MLFEVSQEKTDRYVIREFELAEEPSEKLCEKLDVYKKDTPISVVLFEDKGRFDLAISLGDTDDLIWVCNKFTIPQDIQSDIDYISGMIYGWIHGVQ